MKARIAIAASLLFLAASAAPAPAQAPPAQPAGCQFILGFKTLHDLAAADIGDCLDNQSFVANGDALQHTTKGLMAWRKADNWTAFTNGYETWINGPAGLARRLNTDRFPWEAGQPAAAAAGSAAPANTAAVGHIIAILLENHSFDNIYGLFPGANGVAAAASAPKQADKQGRVYPTLPQPVNDYAAYAPDTRFPADLPNAPFPLNKYVQPQDSFGSAEHYFYIQQNAVNGGKMDRIVAWGGTAGLVMGYWDTSQLPLAQYASKYTLLDNFFQGAWGDSFVNNLWQVCACAATFPNAPAVMRAQLDGNGGIINRGAVSPDGFVIDQVYSVFSPHLASAPPETLLPPQTAPTIGDRLNDKGVSWAWYAGGWNAALAGNPDDTFRPFHQAFMYFKNFGDGTDQKRLRLKDEQDFLAALKDGSLPAVSFVKPIGADDEHPGYTTMIRGEQHTVSLLQAIEASPVWKDTVVVVTYDESGGLYDHVAPPQIDRWGPGPRVPALVISPFAKKGFVDHTQAESTSILSLIEARYGLAPLASRDAGASNLLSALSLP